MSESDYVAAVRGDLRPQRSDLFAHRTGRRAGDSHPQAGRAPHGAASRRGAGRRCRGDRGRAAERRGARRPTWPRTPRPTRRRSIAASRCWSCAPEDLVPARSRSAKPTCAPPTTRGSISTARRGSAGSSSCSPTKRRRSSSAADMVAAGQSFTTVAASLKVAGRRALGARPAGQGRSARAAGRGRLVARRRRRERTGPDPVRLASGPAGRDRARADAAVRGGQGRAARASSRWSARPASFRTSPRASTTSWPPARPWMRLRRSWASTCSRWRSSTAPVTRRQGAARGRPAHRRHPDPDLRGGPGRDLAAGADPGRALLHVPCRRRGAGARPPAGGGARGRDRRMAGGGAGQARAHARALELRPQAGSPTALRELAQANADLRLVEVGPLLRERRRPGAGPERRRDPGACSPPSPARPRRTWSTCPAVPHSWRSRSRAGRRRRADAGRDARPPCSTRSRPSCSARTRRPCAAYTVSVNQAALAQLMEQQAQ